MSRSLTPASSLDNFRKEAKRWLKALRAGDAAARRRLVLATPAAPDDPGLRDVQLALAREHGFPGWSALRQALEDLSLERLSQAERVDAVLRSATWNGDRATASRFLARWPELAAASLLTAVSTGKLDEVERHLAGEGITELRLPRLPYPTDFSLLMVLVITLYNRVNPWLSLGFFLIAAGSLGLMIRQLRMLPPMKRFE